MTSTEPTTAPTVGQQIISAATTTLETLVVDEFTGTNPINAVPTPLQPAVSWLEQRCSLCTVVMIIATIAVLSIGVGIASLVLLA